MIRKIIFILSFSIILLLGQKVGIASDVSHIFSEDHEIEQKIEEMFYQDFDERYDLLIYHISNRGFECSLVTVSSGVSVFCDSLQPVRSRTQSGQVIWVGFRRSIQIESYKQQIEVEVTSGIIAP